MVAMEIKGFGDGEGNQRGKREKKRKFGENIVLIYNLLKKT